MTFLKSAPVLKIKQKGGTPASSPVVAQKRKSDVMTTLAADSSKKLAKTTQDKGKKVVIDSPVRPRDFLAMQEKLLAEIPYEEEKESGKKQYDQAVSDYIYTTLSKVPDFDFSLLGDEAAEMAEAFRSMSPTRTQGNLPDEIEGVQAEEVENEVVSKIVDEAAPDETTPAA